MLRFLKENKKGISLVEIIVALAIAGILLSMLGGLISQGAILFKHQNTIVDLANESQLVSGQFEQTLMEARALIIHRDIAGGNIYIYTGEINAAGTGWKDATGVERTIIVTKTHMYVSNGYIADVSEMNEGNMITSYLKDFSIAIGESSKEYIKDENGLIVGINYLNPIVAEIDYVLSSNDREKTADLVLKLRNYIEFVEDKNKAAE